MTTWKGRKGENPRWSCWFFLFSRGLLIKPFHNSTMESCSWLKLFKSASFGILRFPGRRPLQNKSAPEAFERPHAFARNGFVGVELRNRFQFSRSQSASKKTHLNAAPPSILLKRGMMDQQTQHYDDSTWIITRAALPRWLIWPVWVPGWFGGLRRKMAALPLQDLVLWRKRTQGMSGVWMICVLRLYDWHWRITVEDGCSATTGFSPVKKTNARNKQCVNDMCASSVWLTLTNTYISYN